MMTNHAHSSYGSVVLKTVFIYCVKMDVKKHLVYVIYHIPWTHNNKNY